MVHSSVLISCSLLNKARLLGNDTDFPQHVGRSETASLEKKRELLPLPYVVQRGWQTHVRRVNKYYFLLNSDCAPCEKVYIKRNSFCSARCNRFGFSWQRAIRAVFTCDRFVLRVFTRDMFYIFLLVGRWRRGEGRGVGRTLPSMWLSYLMAQLLIRSHCTVLFSYHNRHTSLSLSSD